MSIRLLSASVLAVCIARPVPLYADVVELRGGNRITGLVLDHKSGRREIRVLTARGEVPVPREQVEAVRAGRSPADRYAQAVEFLKPADVDGRFELAQWCAAQGLKAESEKQLRSVLQLDPDHVAARRLLGFKRQQGKWVRAEGLSEGPLEGTSGEGKAPTLDGLAPASGTEDAIRLIEDPVGDSKESLASRRASWDREVNRMAKWLESNNDDRARQARDQLSEIRDPMAVPALVRAMRHGNEDSRARIIATLGAITGPEATSALALAAVLDESPNLRWMATEQLRERDARDYRPALIAALRSSIREVIFNGAEAASELQDVALTPYLVGALEMDSTSTYEAAPIFRRVVVMDSESLATRL